jgi:serine/threonine-protein phosphatase 6 catalytic subunit
MWSDPDSTVPQWVQSPRGAGYLFGERVTKEVWEGLNENENIFFVLQFNHMNSISLICRAHQLVMEGYKHSFSDSSLVTVWYVMFYVLGFIFSALMFFRSAPNYCYRCGNVAAIMQLNEDLNSHFIMFSEVPDTMREVPPTMPVPYFM